MPSFRVENGKLVSTDKAPTAKKDSKRESILEAELAEEKRLLEENPEDAELHNQNIKALEKELS